MWKKDRFRTLFYSCFNPPNLKKHPNFSFQNLKIVIFFSSPKKFHAPFLLFVPKRNPLRAHFKTLFHKIVHEITIRVSYIYSWFNPPNFKKHPNSSFQNLKIVIFFSSPQKFHAPFFIICPQKKPFKSAF